MISRSPNDDPAADQKTAMGQSRLAAGPPPSGNVRPAPSDPAANTLAMLGESPLDQQNGGAVGGDAGGAGVALAGLSAMLQGAQMIGTALPGFVPPEISLWLQGAMSQMPQMLQQMQSAMTGMGAAVGGGAMPMLGPMGGGMVPPGGGAAPMGAQPGGMAPQPGAPTAPQQRPPMM